MPFLLKTLEVQLLKFLLRVQKKELKSEGKTELTDTQLLLCMFIFSALLFLSLSPFLSLQIFFPQFLGVQIHVRLEFLRVSKSDKIYSHNNKLNCQEKLSASVT